MPACLETLVPRSKLRPMSRSQWPKLEGRRGRVHAFALSFPSRSSLPGARRTAMCPSFASFSICKHLQDGMWVSPGQLVYGS